MTQTEATQTIKKVVKEVIKATTHGATSAALGVSGCTLGHPGIVFTAALVGGGIAALMASVGFYRQQKNNQTSSTHHHHHQTKNLKAKSAHSIGHSLTPSEEHEHDENNNAE
jgi:hypothetical protein